MLIQISVFISPYELRQTQNVNSTILTSHVCSTDESELKEFPVGKTLSRSCYTDEEVSKGIIFDKALSQICSTDEDESKVIIFDECSTE